MRENRDTTDHPVHRRDFLKVATIGTGTITIGAALWGLGQTLAPAQFHDPMPTVDLKSIPMDAPITLRVYNKPVFVRRLSSEQINDVHAVPIAKLRDEYSRNANLPLHARATVENRSFTQQETFVVLSGVCPRRGCVPYANQGDFGGWYCPCGGAHYDVLGRLRKGASPSNLLIPRFGVSNDGIITFLSKKSGPSQKVIDALLFGRPSSG